MTPTEPEHTNQLIDQTSPYLLQHAHNPVDWYPWCSEAFEKAKREDKPIFLSIGYSTCYWCHVMEKECFEDTDVAAVLNEQFLAIKVDREERPDVDEQYMIATQLLTRRGGWPNSVWLTPDAKPWMAATYLPKPNFIETLNKLAELWRSRRNDVEKQAEQLTAAISQIGAGDELRSNSEPSSEMIDKATEQFTRNFDSDFGGYGDAPKFPPHGTLALLIRQYRDTREDAMRDQLTQTLDAMWLGGIHDHLGGGFHRYSTDRKWLVPHFEKMLYDNTQLLRSYTDAYLLTQTPHYRHAVEDIYRWIHREMTAPNGGFYAAIDAGDVGKEGHAYTWTPEEVDDVLGKQDGALFREVYGFESGGNFVDEASGKRENRNIPHLQQSLVQVAEQRGEDPQAFEARIAEMRKRLFKRRETWQQPRKDDKILASWNGMLIEALAYAGRKLKEPRYLDAASDAADFVVEHMMKSKTLYRAYRADQAKQPGYLDDYAHLAAGVLELYRAADNDRWLEVADTLLNKLCEDFQDASTEGFFYTSSEHDNLLMRSRSVSGGGNLPNPSGVAISALIDAALLCNKPQYLKSARTGLKSLVGLVENSPFGSESILLAAARLLRDRDVQEFRGEHVAEPEISESDKPDAEKRVDPVSIRVDTSQRSAVAGDDVLLNITLDIEDGFRLYAKNTESDDLHPVSISVETDESLRVGQMQSPSPKKVHDPAMDRPLQAYEGCVCFRIPLHVVEDVTPETSAIAVRVNFQACGPDRCLPPQSATLGLTVKVQPRTTR